MLIALAAIGCSSEFDVEISGDFQPLAKSDCELCGQNGATVGGTDVNEMALDPNEGATATVAFVTTPAGERELVVRGDVLYARDHVGTKVVDTPLEPLAVISVYLDGQVGLIELEIAQVSQIEHWVAPDSKATATGYHFKEVLPNNGRRDVCPDLESDSHDDPDDLLPRQMFAFTGDRYDWLTGEVTVGAETNGWITLACKGSVPAKLHLARHTTASSNQWFDSHIRDRQAFVYLLRADYCGIGEPNTVNGKPLRYLDKGGWFEGFYRFEDEVEAFEALWDETGAICLDLPRHVPLEDILCDGVPIPSCDAEGPRIDWGNARFKSGLPKDGLPKG